MSFDSQGNPDRANNGATTLINDHVVAVIGPAFSGESAAADPIFEAARIPNISASATNINLAENGWKFFHRVLADDAAQGTGDGDYLTKTLGAKTVAVIDDSGVYGEGLANVVRSTIKANGADDVLDDHIDPKGVDYGATVNKVIATKPAALFFGGYYDAAGRLMEPTPVPRLHRRLHVRRRIEDLGSSSARPAGRRWPTAPTSAAPAPT